MRLMGLIGLALLAGCAVTKIPVAAGGSRADGTVTMAFQYGGFERPSWNLDQTRQAAASKCAAWGYADAQVFGSQMQNCMAWNAYGCIAWTVTIPYQCVGGGAR